MDIYFDPAKNERERGLPFTRAYEFDFETASFHFDNRKDYGETRMIAVGYLDKRLHILCFKELEDSIRVISFRKANAKEARNYGKDLTID